MDKITGFMKYPREGPKKRPIDERVKDWDSLYVPPTKEKLKMQAARCMDCGIPFCHQGCPLGNLIPEWNEHAFNNDWEKAIRSLEETNNFPEFTGWLCPAPCEDSCVLALNDRPVTIKEIEKEIIVRAFKEGWITAHPPKSRTGKKVAVIGSGPAGLAGSQQLNGAGHTVTVFERDDRIGGLIRYGIPDFKMDKTYIDKRIKILEEEGILFRTNTNVGVDIPLSQLQQEFDAILLAGGALLQKDILIPGRELEGVHFAMPYLTQQNRILNGDHIPKEKLINSKDKKVIIIGGGDTGADCYGTARRQGASSVIQFQYHPRQPLERDPINNPWPEPPHVFRTSPVYEEGGERRFSILTKELPGKHGKINQLLVSKVNVSIDENGLLQTNEIPNTEHSYDVDLVFIAIGFKGPDCIELIDEVKLIKNSTGNIWRDKNWMTNVPGIFVAGDMMRGASLIVWAIADGRSAARGIDQYLMGESDLPAPLD